MQNQPFTEIEAAISAIDRFPGQGEDFSLSLSLSDSLLDPVGINMAIITDKALARGWFPAGFEQREGYRIYRYES